MASPSLLDGVRVLDLSRVLAGPWCTMILGDLGADVIKVERPGTGDDTRNWGPPFTEDGRSAYYLCANRNKRSIELDLKTEEGRALVAKLVARSDVLVENFRAGTLEALGFSDERLRELRPDLIHCSVTAFGQTGPHASEPGYDFLLQARGGLMSITGPPGTPHKVGVAVCDLFAGQNAAMAVLAALFARERGHGGERIDISLFRTQVSMLANVASNYLVSGENPKAHGNAHANITPYQALPTRDVPIAIGVGNDEQWRRLCSAIGRAEWADDPRFATNVARIGSREALAEGLEAAFRERSCSEWLELLEGLSIPCAPIQSIEQVFRDSRAEGLRIELDGVPQVASPFTISGASVQYRHAPPKLGEHTDEILAELADQ